MIITPPDNVEGYAVNLSLVTTIHYLESDVVWTGTAFKRIDTPSIVFSFNESYTHRWTAQSKDVDIKSVYLKIINNQTVKEF